ncbi:MAG: hypothetical protein WCB04_03365 [Mycobacteriales bacterium]
MLQRMPTTYPRSVVISGAVSLVLTVGFLFLPLAGTDLAAQVARGHFTQEYGLKPVDFRWYGGIFPFGYSLLTGPLNALIGSRGVGAVASVIGAVAFAFLLVRTKVRRPLLGGVLGAVCLVFNLISGRTTFALGLAFGLVALCIVTLEEVDVRLRTTLIVLASALATAASPVAGLFTGLAGGALLLTGRRRDGLALGIGAAVPMVVVTALFRDGGIQPFDADSAKLVIALSIAVIFLVPAQYRALRAGAMLSALGLFAAYLIPTPIGFNAARLALLFSIPVVAATANLPWPRLLVALVLISWWQPPLVVGDLSGAGHPSAHRAFHQPLIDQLRARGPVGRVEVVPLRDHWESTFVADAVPVARGWERQVDVGRNPLFYGVGQEDTLTSPQYLGWLYDNAVAYVAVPIGTSLDRWGSQEAALIAAGLPYLQLVWGNDNWQLYKVNGPQPLVSAPAKLARSDATGVTFDMDRPGTVVIRVQWSRWLTLSGPRGCLTPGGKWTVVRIDSPGTYRLSSGWHLAQPRRC